MYVAYVVSLLIVFYVFMSIQVNSSYQHSQWHRAAKLFIVYPALPYQVIEFDI